MEKKLTDNLREFLLEQKCKGLSAKSLQNYKEFVTPFIRFKGKSACAPDITQEAINEYISELYDRKLSKATIATYTRHIKVFLNWLSEECSVSYKTEKIPMPKTYKKNVLLYTDEQIKQIFDSVSAEPEWIALRNRACISLMLDSGLRRAEVCSLKTRDYDPERERITVCGKGDKERIVPLGKLSRKLVEQYREKCPFDLADHLFVDRRGDPLSINALKLLIQKIAKKLPFEFSCHKLRHNFATNYCIDMYRQKGNMDAYSLQILLGHASMNTTMRYIHHAKSIVASEACISHLDGIFGL